MSLVLGLSGVLVCWLPAWGWIGLVLAIAGCTLSFRGFADPSTSPGDLGYNVAGFVLGGWALIWGLALQIKHSAGAIDTLLIPGSLNATLIASLAAGSVFWTAVFVARRVIRVPLLIVATIALVALIAAGSSAMVFADREFIQAAAPQGE